MRIHFLFVGKLPFTDFEWWDLIETWILWNSAPKPKNIDRYHVTRMPPSIQSCWRLQLPIILSRTPYNHKTSSTTFAEGSPPCGRGKRIHGLMGRMYAQASSRPVRSMWEPPERLDRSSCWRMALVPPLCDWWGNLVFNDFHWWQLNSVNLGCFQTRTVLIQMVVEWRGNEWICDWT